MINHRIIYQACFRNARRRNQRGVVSDFLNRFERFRYQPPLRNQFARAVRRQFFAHDFRQSRRISLAFFSAIAAALGK